MNWTMSGTASNDLITVAFAARGTRITAAGESRANIGS